MVLLKATYVERKREIMSDQETDHKPKQKGQIQEFIILNGKKATTVRGAQQILTERAKSLGSTRTYSRDAVYRLLIDNKITAIRTPSANYYYVDELEKVPITPQIGRAREKPNYSPEIKQKALELSKQGLTQREIAQQLGMRFQTVGNWIRANKRVF